MAEQAAIEAALAGAVVDTAHLRRLDPEIHAARGVIGAAPAPDQEA